jgi:outer membrane autotransporter protein
MRLRYLVLFLAASPAWQSVAVEAQFLPRPSCQATPASTKAGSPGALACAEALINREIIIHNADVLQRIVGGSFDFKPSEIVPAGLGDLTASEAEARLATSAATVIEPAAEQASIATPRWNFWVDGKYTWNDSSPANYDLDGGLINAMIGADYKLTSKVTVGLLGSAESSRLDGTAVTTRSDGFGGGPYLGIVLTDNIVFSANFLASSLKEGQSGLLHFDATRLQGATALTGYYFHNTWRFTPALSLSWSEEWQDETANLVPDQTIETALLSPSIQIGNTIRLSDTATVEPWAGAALDWTFLSRIKPNGAPALDNPGVDLRLQAGLNFGLGPKTQLSLTGEVGGLIDKSVDTYSGEANLAIQF